MCCCITSEGILTNYMINKFTDKIRWIYLPFLLLIIVFLISLFAMCVWMYKKRQSVSYALFRIHCLYYCCSYSYKFSMDLYFCDPQNRIAWYSSRQKITITESLGVNKYRLYTEVEVCAWFYTLRAAGLGVQAM